MKKQQGKIALVTGGSRGIGAAIARKLAGDGVHLLVHYSASENDAKSVQRDIVREGGKADLVKADFSDLGNIRFFFNQIDKTIGDQKIDILVNNAGIPNPADITKINNEQFDRLMCVNVKAPFFITREALSRMNDGGRIINISSRASKSPHPQSGVYAMTKAALDIFTIQMASQLGSRKISVNSVAPGPILTDMNRGQFANKEIRKQVANWSAMKGIGDPTDVAELVAFLVSPAAGWITGQWIEVSGGLGL